VATYLLDKNVTGLGETALTLDPNNLNVLLLLAKLHLQKGNYPEAFRFTQEYQKLDPNNDEAWALLGNVPKRLLLSGLGDIEFARFAYKEAASAYEQAYQLFAEKQVIKLYILLRLGDLYMKIGRYSSAKDIYLETCRMSASAYVRVLQSTSAYF
jgi:tetratricopeptide (TPR) repeat protein